MFFLSLELQAEVYHYFIIYLFIIFSIHWEEKSHFIKILIAFAYIYQSITNSEEIIWWSIGAYENHLPPLKGGESSAINWLLEVHGYRSMGTHKIIVTNSYFVCVFCVRKTPKTLYHSEERRVHYKHTVLSTLQVATILVAMVPRILKLAIWFVKKSP